MELGGLPAGSAQVTTPPLTGVVPILLVEPAEPQAVAARMTAIPPPTAASMRRAPRARRVVFRGTGPITVTPSRLIHRPATWRAVGRPPVPSQSCVHRRGHTR